MSKILDLGCGPYRKLEGSIGVDINSAPHVDMVHNLDEYPYPFEDNRFQHIEMSHILEHIVHPARAMDEVYRVARPDATVRIVTPHYTSQLSYGDLTHYHHFGHVTFTTLCNGGKFRLEKSRLIFTDFYKFTGISIFANLFPRRWEKYFGFIFPALYVDVVLCVLKEDS